MWLYSKYDNVNQNVPKYARHIKKHKKRSKTIRYYNSLHSIIFLVTQVNWVVLDSPWGTCFWLRTKIACPPTPPQPVLIIHRHLRILLFYGTITIDFVSCHRQSCFLFVITLLFVQLNLILILILRHIYIEKLVIKT